MDSPQYFPVKLQGLVKDLPPEEAGPDQWSQVVNMHFKDKSTKRSGGYESYLPLPANSNVMYMLPVQTAQTAYWIYTTDSQIFVTDGTNVFDITPAAGVTITEVGAWTGGVLNGLPFLNNGADIPVFWDLQTANICQPLPGWIATDRCKALRATQFHLIAMNMTENSVVFPHKVKWSNGADPGTMPTSWTPEADNDAGDVILSSTAGEIVDGGKLRDSFIVYKRQSTFIMSYVAGQYVFTTRALFVTSGVQATNCAVEMRGFHYVLSDDDVIRHDGNNIESLAQWKIKNDLIGSINPQAFQACCVSARHSTDEMWFCIPKGTGIRLDTAAVLNTITGDFGLRDLPDVSYVARGIIPRVGVAISWDDDPDSWESDITRWNEANYSLTADALMMGDYENERLLTVDTSDDNDGADVFAYCERTGLSVQDPDINDVLFTQVWPRITGRLGDVVQIRVGGQDFFDQTIEWDVPRNYVIGQTEFVDCLVEKRYLSINFASTGGQVWQLHGFRMAGTRQGLY